MWTRTSTSGSSISWNSFASPRRSRRLIRFAREGPRGAQVERVEVAEEEPEGVRGFFVG